MSTKNKAMYNILIAKFKKSLKILMYTIECGLKSLCKINSSFKLANWGKTKKILTYDYYFKQILHK